VTGAGNAEYTNVPPLPLARFTVTNAPGRFTFLPSTILILWVLGLPESFHRPNSEIVP
jgi:hypothetical protein